MEPPPPPHRPESDIPPWCGVGASHAPAGPALPRAYPRPRSWYERRSTPRATPTSLALGGTRPGRVPSTALLAPARPDNQADPTTIPAAVGAPGRPRAQRSGLFPASTLIPPP